MIKADLYVDVNVERKRIESSPAFFCSLGSRNSKQLERARVLSQKWVELRKEDTGYGLRESDHMQNEPFLVLHKENTNFSGAYKSPLLFHSSRAKNQTTNFFLSGLHDPKIISELLVDENQDLIGSPNSFIYLLH